MSICAALALLALTNPSAPASAAALGATTPAAPTDGGQDWTTWGYDVQRTGFNPNEHTLGPTTVHGLRLLWSFPFALKSDNAPVLASGVLVNDVPISLIYAGDRTGTFHAVNADTGAEVWSRQLGTNVTCAGVLGVTDTAVIDRSTNLLYVAGGDGKLYALDLATGQDAPGWPLQITSFPNEYVWSAITEFDGSLYVAIASRCDGLGTNYGRVVRVDPLSVTQTAAFYVTDGPNTGVWGGGVWGWVASPSTRRTATPTRCPRTGTRRIPTSTSTTRRAWCAWAPTCPWSRRTTPG
jgi:outer membrane protein assembly factor BamB